MPDIRELVHAYLAADGHIIVEVTPFAPPDHMKEFADEIAEIIARALGLNVDVALTRRRVESIQ